MGFNENLRMGFSQKDYYGPAQLDIMKITTKLLNDWKSKIWFIFIIFLDFLHFSVNILHFVT